MNPQNLIRLEFYRPAYKQQIETYVLPEEQAQFTAQPLDALAVCEQDAERFPVLIFSNDSLAGFFVLHGWGGVQQYYDNEKALLLRAYSVNPSFQGKGIAQESLKLLPEFVKIHFPEKNEIMLCVNYHNTQAQHVYKKSGFQDRGLRAMGRKGEMFIFHLRLSY
ncbi:GNAT family N-acetyltransferase [Neobacillus dielmonensis]|uniref:GNAT family N-acetyltransferase n=1 Tax=Neobacillus dielmonensis TaxID=1347369 RepID=UPI0005A74637|nr:GNAT family N-acetyltransferase [Neobacillus dielmonensis]